MIREFNKKISAKSQNEVKLEINGKLNSNKNSEEILTSRFYWVWNILGLENIIEEMNYSDDGNIKTKIMDWNMQEFWDTTKRPNMDNRYR